MASTLITTDHWQSILIQKRDSFSLLGLSALSIVNNQESFHRHFEKECWRLREPRAQTLLGKLDYSFYHIDPFIQAINTATLSHEDSGYSNLIWGAAFAVIECVSRNGTPQRPDDLRLNGKNGPVQLITDLNKSIPDFQSDLQYAGETSVQGALQDMFETYVDCCLSLIVCFTEKTFPSLFISRLEVNSPRDCVTYAATQIANAKIQFDTSVSLLSVLGPSKQAAVPRSNDLPLQYSMPGEWPSYLQQQRILPSAFQFEKFLGHGGSGHVEKVTRKSDGKSFARKQIDRPPYVQWTVFRDGVLEEIKIMQKLKSVHVVTVEFYNEDPERLMEIFMTPVADGNLDQILRGCVEFGYREEKIQQIYSWFGCLLNTLAYVHSCSVRHQDIKPHNVLVKDGKVYLTDFGLSRDFIGGLSQSNSSFSGTSEYQAPEFDSHDSHGRPSDIFSLGCVFSEMLTVVRRKDLDEFKRLRNALVLDRLGRSSGILSKPRYSFHKSLERVKAWVRNLGGDPVNDFLVRLILSMLEYDPNRRVSAKDALEMLERFKELSCKCYS